MANPAYVQSNALTTNTANTFVSPNTAGNLLIAMIRIGGILTPPSPTITDSQGNTWQIATSETTGDSAAIVVLAYATKCKAGANTVTGHLGGGSFYQLLIAEYSGADTLDQTGIGQSTSSSPTATTGSMTQNVELVIAGVMNNTSNTISYSIGGSFNLRQGASSTNAAFADATLTTAKGTTSTATFTDGGVSIVWAQVMATFYQSGSGPAPLGWLNTQGDFRNKRGVRG